jgi:(1->4)-alpha-D-glucan 1-alpha-D-glucosylmutase
MLAEADEGGASVAQVNRFARKVQQLTAPVMAKGVEDTSFYIYNRLVSLNDVGGDPATFGYGVNAFHGASADRAAKWPHTMLATSTHDNKRSEDTRARINVLSEMPEQWHQYLRRWSRMNLAKKREVDGEPAPSRNDEYLLYQTLIGSFPEPGTSAKNLDDYRGRIEQYMLKAIREAKVRTSWVDTNAAYETAVVEFVRAVLSETKRNLFLGELRDVVRTVGWLGMLNSMSMTLLKLTSPGVPDIYQGNELWDFSLADPDNRRAVDFEKRRQLLADLDGAQLSDLFADAESGRLKLFTIRKLLALRKENPSWFLHGGYTPLQVTGERATHVVGFARRYQGAGVIAVAGRLFATMDVQTGEVPRGVVAWRDSRVDLPFLAEGTSLRDVLSGGVCTVREGGVALAGIFAMGPVAALAYAEGEQ